MKSCNITWKFNHFLCIDKLKKYVIGAELGLNLVWKKEDNPILQLRKIPRKVALLEVRRKMSDQHPVFVLKYDPRLPSMSNTQAKHWRAMVAQDQHLAEVFKQPPLIAYKRQRSLKDILVKSKIPPPIERYPQRTLKGMAKCGKTFPACPYVKTGSEVKHRFSEHRCYVNNQVKSVATGEHFNLPGNSLANVTMTILEQVKKKQNHL